MTRRISVLMTAVFLFGSLSMSCFSSSKEFRLTGNPDNPAAEGTAKVSTSDNGNTEIDLVVKHLAPPERINPGATVYVVWAQGSENGALPQSLGALNVDDNLNGSISTTTALRSFDLYITAEPSRASTAPTGKTLLKTMVEMKK